MQKKIESFSSLMPHLIGKLKLVLKRKNMIDPFKLLHSLHNCLFRSHIFDNNLTCSESKQLRKDAAILLDPLHFRVFKFELLQTPNKCNFIMVEQYLASLSSRLLRKTSYFSGFNSTKYFLFVEIQ